MYSSGEAGSLTYELSEWRGVVIQGFEWLMRIIFCFVCLV